MTNPSVAATKPERERVAIVAVHGVAYHAPGASANAMSELLLGLSKDKSANYGPFATETVQVTRNPKCLRRSLPFTPSVPGN
jgi:hypothetical protein